MSNLNAKAVFGAELTAYGENLADAFTLPRAAATATDSQAVGGTMSSVEMVVLAQSAVTAATLKVEVEDSKDGVDFAPTGWAFSVSAVNAAPGAQITRFCMPSNIRKHVRAKIASAADASGTLSLNLVYLPR